jgi:putative transposase
MAVGRRFTPELKARVVLELISGATSLAEACRQYNLKPQTVSRWKVEFLEKAPQLFQTREQSSQERARIAELERMIGRLTLELEIAKKASAILNGTLGRSERWSWGWQQNTRLGSSYYYQAREPDDQVLKEAITAVVVTWPTYGYRRITAQLKRAGWRVNSKRVRRLMGELGFQRKIYRKKRRTTNSDHTFPRYPNLVQGLAVVKPDQVWVGDITYVRLHREFVYLAVLLDVFTRCIRGWHLGRSLSQELTLSALQRALAQRLPEIHHSDQGVQYAATGYVQLLQEAGVRNGYAERVMRTIKEEEVDLSEYQDYGDAYRQIGQFLEDAYMKKRIHSSLGYLTPVEFENQGLVQQGIGEVVH